ncbi:MAG: cytoplasmic protein [Variovorax sp.]|nr:MAG: cytoplasmic protein [Variovorax sp.]
MHPDDLERLVTQQMPFGKHKGVVIADLPGNYLNWFAREGFPNGEIGRLLQLMHEIDHNGLKGLLDPLRRRR